MPRSAHIRAAPLLVALLGLVACSRGSPLQERLEVAPGGLLEVDLYMGEGLRPDKGSLEVRSHDSGEVSVLATSSGWGASGVHYRLEPEGRSVRLYGRVTGALSWLFGGPQLTVQIWVPREYSLDVRSSAGAIRIEDVRGDVRARGADDTIEVSGTTGNVRLRAENCDVRVSEVQGDVDVRTSGGAISLAWIRGRVEARSERGDIDASHVTGPFTASTVRGQIEIRDAEGRTEAHTERGSIVASFLGAPAGNLETSRGDVHVSLSDGVGAELDASARDGDVALTGLEIDGVREPTRAVGRIGAGGHSLRLYSAGGNVRLSRR